MLKLHDGKSRRLEVIYRPIADIKPDPNNPRTHPKSQVKQLAQLIEAYGFSNPILIDEHGVVIAGHGRLLAAQLLGLTEIPTIMLVGLAEEKKIGLRMADNRIALGSGWDNDLLQLQLGAIQELNLGFDLTLTGFSAGEIDMLMKPRPDDQAADERLPEEPPLPRAKAGDIWIMGPHRVGCGDCRDHDFVRRVVGAGDVAHAAFLDPPYNVSIAHHANVRSKHKEFKHASGEMTPDQFQAFLTQTLGACVAVSRNGAVHFVCMDWRHWADLDVASSVYGSLLNVCVWNKSNGGMGSLYRSKHELVFVYRVGDAQHFNAVELGRHGRNRTNVWDYASVNTGGARGKELDWHPTVKPVAMVADAIKDVTKRGQIVLDAFLGSGTTLIACQRAGRVCRGIEIDPAYVDIAIERWELMTGQKAVLEPKLSWGQVLPEGRAA